MFHNNFLGFTVMVEKVNWKLGEPPLSLNIVKCIPGESAAICVTIKDLNDAGVVIPTTLLFKLPDLACRRQILENDRRLL